MKIIAVEFGAILTVHNLRAFQLQRCDAFYWSKLMIRLV